MSNRNDAESTMGFIIFGVIAMVGFFLFFLASLLSLVLTLLSIWAWNEKRDLFGATITPKEARILIGAGVAGAIVVGLFGVTLYATDMLEAGFVGWMPVVGYVIGSISVFSMLVQEEERRERAEREAQMLAAHRTRQTPPHQVTPPKAQEREFEFASWNDEEPRV